MIDIQHEIQCSGCTACANICRHGAITMEADSLGFFYPKVNASACVGCGLCDKVCQFHPNYERYDYYTYPNTFAARIKDVDQLSKSQSGALFYVIADYVLSLGGVVYGATFDVNWHVVHLAATDRETLESLRFSKYVQTDIRGIFLDIRHRLQLGDTILFTGTPCQVAGLKAYIPNHLHTKLICIDLICHGVPSPAIWENYLQYLERKHHARITKACFRDKSFGWRGAKESFEFANGDKENRYTSNMLYFAGLSVRPSCTACVFTNTSRVGDITLGDFWGISQDARMNDNKGVSLVFINSAKGEGIFLKVIPDLDVENITLEQSLQPQLKQPTCFHHKREQFVRDYEKYGFEYVGKKYGDMSYKYKLFALLRQVKYALKI